MQTLEPIASPAPWSNDRYAPLRLIGSGSFGEVYLVYDRIRSHEVALKLLHQRDAETARALRKEFRALKDLDHVNLVELYELHIEERVGYFTMEYVEGTTIDAYVDAAGSPRERATRTRTALRQLVDAVEAMHTHGILHRDLKPTNIVVTAGERLVVLDAGLAKNLESQSNSERYICGTAWYMSPEQALGRHLTTASDWYSVGVIAHRLHTGKVPFEGEPMLVLQHKTLRAPPSVATLRPDLPAADVRMVDGLLALTPDARPGADALRQWLDAGGDEAARSSAVVRPQLARFVGRAAELARLDALVDAVALHGQTDTVQIVGDAGMGKSTLVTEWLTTRSRERALHVLKGRCFQRESAPYNGLDELFAALIEALAAGLEPELPAERAALVGFLSERADVSRVARASVDAPPQHGSPDPVERRRLLGLALHHLLVQRAHERATVLWLDDAQWSSRETATLLGELLHRAWPRGLLLVLTCRRALEGAADGEPAPVAALVGRGSRLDLGALDDAAAATLFTLHGGPAERCRHVLEEANGHPMLLAQAALFGQELAEPLSLRAILTQRILALDADARALLEVLCVADAPLSEAVALAVVGSTSTTRAARKLVASGLATRVGVSGHRLIPFHATVRAAVLERLADTRVEALHLALARVLEQTPGVEPDALVVHYLAAGARAQALLHMRRSARHLADALAFDRAVSMYKRLLVLSDAGSDVGSDAALDDRLALREELAVALENAGRCEEAGRAWLALAEEHTGATRQQLRQRAADNLIRSGHVDEGLAAQKAALDRLGVRVSRSAWLALPFIVLDRIRLRLRGLGYRLQPSSHADPRRLARIDASMALGAVLPLIDTIRGLQVHGQALRDALAAGEPARLARALAMEAGYRNALSGGVDRRGRIDALLVTAGLVAEASGEPRAKGTVAIMYGSARWSVGDWAGCISHCQRGLERLRGECTGVSWEINFALTHSINALLWSGRLNDHRREALASLADARARGDLYAEVMYSVRDLATLHVQADAPDAARATRQELERWTNRGFQIEHLVELYQQSEVMLYEQRGDEAWAWVTSRWSALRRSQLLRLQVFRIELRALRARAALCALADLPRGRSRARLVAEARSLAHAIAREAPAVRALVLGAPLTAAVAAIDGRDDAARAALEAGIHAAQVHGMRLHEAGMQACLGHRIGGDVGRAQVADAARWMHDQGIVAPARYLRMLAPGLAPDG